MALVVSALVPYKRVDLAIEACRHARIPLTIVGRGPEESRLQQLGGGDVRFLGWRTDEEVRELYRNASVVLLPGTEDFGIVPVEAQACGTPVVAYGHGGACETVIDGETGALVADADPVAFADAVARLLAQPPDAGDVRKSAERFSAARFAAAFAAAVDTTSAGPAS